MNVIQLTHQLESRPELPDLADIGLRHFADRADIEVWLELRRRAFAKQQVGVRDWDPAEFSAEFLDKPWWNYSRMWFAETQDEHLLPAEPIGTVTLGLRGSGSNARPVVHWLVVHPRYRRRGVGRLLVAALEQACWDIGHRQIWLETHAGWAEANQFYQAIGYGPAAVARPLA